MHPLRDYIDRVITTNGFIANDHESDGQYWTGYRIFIRNDLDEYQSVEEWKEQTGGWNDRGCGTYDFNGSNHQNVTEYVLQEFNRGCDVLVDAGYRSADLGFGDEGIIESLEKNHLLKMNPDNTVFDVINLHRRRSNLPEVSLAPLPENHPYKTAYMLEYGEDIGDDVDEPDLYDFKDTTSRTAKIEALRVKINELEYDTTLNVDTFQL